MQTIEKRVEEKALMMMPKNTSNAEQDARANTELFHAFYKADNWCHGNE